MYTNNNLSHSDAMVIIEFLRKKIEQLEGDEGAAISVADAHGELLAFLRTDGCRLPSINISMNKAFTAARECVDSSTIGSRSRENNFPVSYYGELRYVGWGGGVPLKHDGKVIGAVGVSGLAEEVDMQLSKEAAEMFANF